MSATVKKAIWVAVLLIGAAIVMKALAPSKEVVTQIEPGSVESQVMSMHEQMMNRSQGGGVPAPPARRP